MSADKDDGGAGAAPKPGWRAWLWGQVLHYATKNVEKLVMAGIALAFGFLVGLVFPTPVTVRLNQSSLGDHCSSDLFEAAEKNGVTMSFDPAGTRHTAVCGGFEYQPGNMEKILLDYLTVFNPQCFTTERTPDAAFLIRANFAEKARERTMSNGASLITCECVEPEQVDLIARQAMVCGVPLK